MQKYSPTLTLLKREWLDRKGYLESEAYCQQVEIAFEHLISALGDIFAKNCDLEKLERFQKYLFEKELSPSSVRSYLKAVRSVFSWACSRSLVPKPSPFEEFKMCKARKRKTHFYTPKELEALLAATGQRGLRHRAMIIAAYETGMRSGEIMNLTFDDIENEVIHVQEKKRTESTWRWSPKFGKERDVPLTKTLRGYIHELDAKLPSDQPYIFLSKRTYTLRRREIEHLSERVRNRPDAAWVSIFTRIKKRAGIKGVFHDLRGTRLTIWSRSLPPQDLKLLAGHSSFQTTMEYYLTASTDLLEKARLAI